MTAPRQLIFDLGHRPALEAEDFLVAASNEAAVALIDSWPDWPAPSALVMGPPRAGKTHLAHVWQKRTGAPIVAARDLGEASIETLQANHALVIEDLDMGIGSEAALFHLMNLAREHGWHLLLTSRIAAGEIQVALPDLRSRLRAAILVQIAPPDDGLLGGRAAGNQLARSQHGADARCGSRHRGGYRQAGAGLQASGDPDACRRGRACPLWGHPLRLPTVWL
jgi:chromosomal replication initiation ATPase DnaA